MPATGNNAAVFAHAQLNGAARRAIVTGGVFPLFNRFGRDGYRLSVFATADELDTNFKTISEHLRRLTAAGLVTKRNIGNVVEHSLSPLGKSILKFLRILE